MRDTCVPSLPPLSPSLELQLSSQKQQDPAAQGWAPPSALLQAAKPTSLGRVGRGHGEPLRMAPQDPGSIRWLVPRGQFPERVLELLSLSCPLSFRP